MDNKKVEAVLNWHTPQMLKELQRFLCFANFYCKFIRNYSIGCSSPDIRKLITWAHISPAAGHPGMTKTIVLLRERYWWLSMMKKVNKMILSCSMCSIQSSETPARGKVNVFTHNRMAKQRESTKKLAVNYEVTAETIKMTGPDTYFG